MQSIFYKPLTNLSSMACNEMTKNKVCIYAKIDIRLYNINLKMIDLKNKAIKYLFIALIHLMLLHNLLGQSNHVFAGGEILNFDTVDLSLNNTTKWSSERSFTPGYFSSYGHAIYIGYSDAINFDGYVKKYGNTAFVFPVGSPNNLRTLSISKPAYASDAYATAWIDGDPTFYRDPTPPYAGFHSVSSVTAPIKFVSNKGQWDWQIGEGNNLGNGTTGNGNDLTITVSMPNLTDFANASELRLVGWNGNSWIDLSGKPTATGNTENSTVSGTMIAGISSIAIGKIGYTYNAVLFPNPVGQFESVHLRFNAAYTGLAELFIQNIVGQTVHTQSIQITNGINTFPINVMKLIKGTYYINVINPDGEKILTGKRFIKL